MRSADRAEVSASAALFCFYLAVAPGHFQSVDGMLMFEQARALLHDGSLLFREPFVWGDVYPTSLYGIGLSLAYLPTLALFSGFESQVFQVQGMGMDLRRIYQDIVYALAATPVQAFVTAFAAHRVARLVRALGFDRETALWGLAFFGLGSPALVYAGSDFAQPLAAACVVLAIERAVAYRTSGAKSALFACAGALVFAVLTRPLEAGLLFPFAWMVCVGMPGRKPRFAELLPSAIALATAFVIAVGVSLLVNALRYGDPLHNEYSALGARFVSPMTGVLGLLVSPARGLAWAFPAIWLAPLATRVLWRDPQARSDTLALIGYPAALLLVTGSWHSWFGGACWGPRFMIPALPLLAAAAAIGWRGWTGPSRTRVGWTLLLLGFACAAPGVLTDFFAGYGSRIASSEGSFALRNFPPLAAWQFTTHVFATSPLDRNAVDIAWFRAAHQTGGLSMLPFFGLLALAGGLTFRAWTSARSPR